MKRHYGPSSRITRGCTSSTLTTGCWSGKHGLKKAGLAAGVAPRGELEFSTLDQVIRLIERYAER
jgi:hypothetical protein